MVFADKIKNENIRFDVKHRTDSYCYYSNTKVSYIKLIVFLLFHKPLLHFEENHWAKTAMLLSCYRYIYSGLFAFSGFQLKTRNSTS